ncbi:MAG: hypothetical protein LC687_03240, partial [Actinobacteria bacterium]|nr:hypothetical protein [Actinomycetota bacterium]
NALLNTTVGNWLVVEDQHMIRAKKAYLLCKCVLCNKYQSIELGRLHRREVNSCRACGQRNRRARQRDSLVLSESLSSS